MPRNLPVHDEQRLQAAVARGALTPARAQYWRVYAGAGHDISFIDQLGGGVVLPAAGTVAAAAGARTVAAASPRPAPEEPDDEADYRALFGSTQQGQQIADAREVAARAAVAAMTDDQLYEAMFGKASAPAAPIAASSAGHASQTGQGQVARKRYRVHAPQVSLRVPRDPNVAAGAEPGETSWKLVELRGGELVPENAHPADVQRLRHQKNRLGPLIKPW